VSLLLRMAVYLFGSVIPVVAVMDSGLALDEKVEVCVLAIAGLAMFELSSVGTIFKPELEEERVIQSIDSDPSPRCVSSCSSLFVLYSDRAPRLRISVCVNERESERERERVCVCVYMERNSRSYLTRRPSHSFSTAFFFPFFVFTFDSCSFSRDLRPADAYSVAGYAALASRDKLREKIKQVWRFHKKQKYTQMHTHTHVHTQIHTQTHSNTNKHTYTHTHTHTHTGQDFFQEAISTTTVRTTRCAALGSARFVHCRSIRRYAYTERELPV